MHCVKPTRLATLALVIVLALGVGASLPGSPAEAQEVKLGFVGPMTGSLAELGQQIRRAAELATEKVNSRGGIEVGGKKYRVRLIVGDDEGLMAERSVAVTQRLIEQDQVAGLVGYVISSNVLAAIPVAQEAKVPLVNTVGKAVSIPEKIAKDKMNYIFQLSPTNNDLAMSHGRLIAQFIKPKKIAFVMLQTDAARDYDLRARAQWPKFVPGVEFQSYFVEQDRQDFQPEILKLRQFQPDMVYVLLVGTHVYAWADQAAAAGLGKSMVIFGDSDYADPTFPQKTGAKTDLHLANAVTFEAPITSLTLPFFQDYRQKYNAAPAYYAVQSYDGMLMMFEGIRRAGKLTGKVAEDRAAIKAGLETIVKDKPVTGVRGNLFFAPLAEGRTVPAEVAVVQFQGGKRVLIWPPGPAAGKFVDPRKR